MDWERKGIIRKVYLSSIAEHAERLYTLAKRLQDSRDYRDLDGTEMANATRTGDLSLEEARLVDHWPTLDSLREIEDKVEDYMLTLQGCYEV